MDSSDKNYYEILEVPFDATSEEINKAYIRAKNAYAGDGLALYSLMSDEECQRILEMIEEAYLILCHPNKRSLYDEAKGIKKRPQYQGEITPLDENSLHSLQSTAQEKSVTKMVAHGRFHLDYSLDPNFEKEIEQTTDWSGQWLKKIREYKNVDLPRLADMTKVSKNYLRYIEEESFENLPASVYVRGFVYQYAKSLKLNPEIVCNSFLYRFKKAKGE